MQCIPDSTLLPTPFVPVALSEAVEQRLKRCSDHCVRVYFLHAVDGQVGFFVRKLDLEHPYVAGFGGTIQPQETVLQALYRHLDSQVPWELGSVVHMVMADSCVGMWQQGEQGVCNVFLCQWQQHTVTSVDRRDITTAIAGLSLQHRTVPQLPIPWVSIGELAQGTAKYQAGETEYPDTPVRCLIKGAFEERRLYSITESHALLRLAHILTSKYHIRYRVEDVYQHYKFFRDNTWKVCGTGIECVFCLSCGSLRTLNDNCYQPDTNQVQACWFCRACNSSHTKALDELANAELHSYGIAVLTKDHQHQMRKWSQRQ